MKSTTTNRRRRGSLEIITTALILTTASTLSYAQNLRRSSSSSIRETTDDMVYDVDIDNSSGSVSYSNLIEGDDFGFHVVSSPMDYEPMNSTLYYDRFRKHHRLLQEETNEMEEDDVEPKEYINDETLTFVSDSVCTYEYFLLVQSKCSHLMLIIHSCRWSLNQKIYNNVTFHHAHRMKCYGHSSYILTNTDMKHHGDLTRYWTTKVYSKSQVAPLIHQSMQIIQSIKEPYAYEAIKCTN